MTDLINIFLAFLIPGVIGFGGGAATIGMVSSIVVNTFGLLTQDQMNMIISFSNALPGPIATLMALGTGFYVKGIVGGVVALIGMVVPSSIMIILLYNLLVKHKEDYRVKRITKFIIPVIVTVFIQISLSFITQSFISINNIYITIGIILVSVICINKLKIHPANLIILAMVFGYFVL